MLCDGASACALAVARTRRFNGGLETAVVLYCKQGVLALEKGVIALETILLLLLSVKEDTDAIQGRACLR